MGDRSPGLISVIRTIVPFGSGGVINGRSVGSGSVGATGAGIAFVFQSPWKTANSFSYVRGTGPSESTTDRPSASWPVTTRRGTLIASTYRAGRYQTSQDRQPLRSG